MSDVDDGSPCPDCGSRWYAVYDTHDECARCGRLFYARIEPTDPPNLPTGRDADDAVSEEQQS